MKKVSKTLAVAALVAAAVPSWAGFETCDDLGDAHVDDGTKVINKRQANNTWDDWVWKGKQDGTIQYCSANSKGCNFGWGQTKTTSYSQTTGWSIGGGFGIEVKHGATGTAAIQAQYQRQKTWSRTQSETFDMRSDLRPGQWAEPVIVAVRRWKSGHFNGAHFKQYYPGKNHQYVFGDKWGCYVYEWAWRDFGSHSGNEFQWGYKMIHVANKRSQL